MEPQPQNKLEEKVRQLYTLLYLLGFIILLAIIAGISLYISNRPSTTPTPTPTPQMLTKSFTWQSPAGYKELSAADLGLSGNNLVLHYYYNPAKISLADAKTYFLSKYDVATIPSGLLVAIGYTQNETTRSGVDEKLAAYSQDTAHYKVSSQDEGKLHFDLVTRAGGAQLLGYVSRSGYPIFILNAGYASQVEYDQLVAALKTINLDY